MHSPCGNVFSSLSDASLTSAGVNHQQDELTVGGVSCINSPCIIRQFVCPSGWQRASYKVRDVINIWACLIRRWLLPLDLGASPPHMPPHRSLPQRYRRLPEWRVWLAKHNVGEKLAFLWELARIDSISMPLASVFCAHFKQHNLKKLTSALIIIINDYACIVHLLQIFVLLTR